MKNGFLITALLDAHRIAERLRQVPGVVANRLARLEALNAKTFPVPAGSGRKETEIVVPAADLVIGQKPKIWAKGADKAPCELYVYDVIGFGGVMAADVQAALKDFGATDTINIYVNSPGGDAFEAKGIVANLLRSKATKNVFVDGVAASAASYIAVAAGDKIVTAKAGMWMVHEAQAFGYGTADELQAQANMVRKENENLARAYAEATGDSVEEMLALMAATTWMNADEALERGFTDEVKDPDQDDDEDENDDGADARARPALVNASQHTQRLIRHIKQENRLQELSRASPPTRSGQPQRPTPQSKDSPR